MRSQSSGIHGKYGSAELRSPSTTTHGQTIKLKLRKSGRTEYGNSMLSMIQLRQLYVRSRPSQLKDQYHDVKEGRDFMKPVKNGLMKTSHDIYSLRSFARKSHDRQVQFKANTPRPNEADTSSVSTNNHCRKDSQASGTSYTAVWVKGDGVVGPAGADDSSER